MTTDAAIVPTGDVAPVYNGTDDPWIIPSGLDVGEDNDGMLIIDGGSSVTNSNEARIGDSFDVTAGTVIVSGAGSLWDNQGDLWVGGFNGTGVLTIEEGAVVMNEYGSIAHNGASGSATVSGPGSMWINNDSLVVGNFGSGQLNVENGGRVTSVDGYINSDSSVPDGVSRASITGTNSMWDIVGTLSVGGPSSLEISNGGSVVSSYMTTVDTSSSDGVTGIVVSGQGSSFKSPYRLTLGDRFDGELTIENGGVVDSGTVILGSGLSSGFSRSTGAVTVDGVGSHLLVPDTYDIPDHLNGLLVVGSRGLGTLQISNGGMVTSTQTRVGEFYSGFNSPVDSVTVTGPGSTWSNAADLLLNGELTIQDQSVVEIGGNITIADGSNAPFMGIINLSDGMLRMHGGTISKGLGTAILNFNGGILEGVGTIDFAQSFLQQGGTLAPGNSIGQTDIIGDYDLIAGTIELELGGPGNPHDLLTATGNIDIALTGTTLDLPALGAMAAGTYTVIESTAGTITGTFEHIAGLGIHPGLIDVAYTPNAVTVTLNWDYLPGDLDGDGFVGIDDLNTVLIAWNQNVTPGLLASGDITGDGYIGIGDLAAVLAHWNTGTPPPQAALNAIPEPATMGLLALGVLGCSGRRRLS